MSGVGVARLMVAVWFLLPAFAEAHPPERSRATAFPPPPERSAAPRIATVVAERCPVFEQPRFEARVVRSARRGTELAVLGVRGPWVRVRFADGVVGFTAKSMLKPGRMASDARRDGPRGTPPVVDRRGAVASRALAEDDGGWRVLVLGGSLRNDYSLTDDAGADLGAGVSYAATDATVEWWLSGAFGASFRVATAFASRSEEFGGEVAKRVEGIGGRTTRGEADLRVRILASTDWRPGIVARAGVAVHDWAIDAVTVTDPSGGERVPIFLVGRSYRGALAGASIDLPLGSPRRGLRLGGTYWMFPQVVEALPGATGSPRGAHGFEARAGAWLDFNERVGAELVAETGSVTSGFGGDGFRFGSKVTNARVSDRWQQIGVGMRFRY